MKKNLPLFYRYAYVIGLTAAFIVVIGWGLLLIHRSTVPRGAMVANTSVGGLPKEEVAIAISKEVNHYKTTPLRLVLNNTIAHATPEELGISFDVEKNSARLASITQRGKPVERALAGLQLALRPSRIPLVASINTDALSQTLLRLFPDDEQPAISASIVIENNNLVLREETQGHIIDRSLLLPALSASAALLEPEELSLRVINDVPSITTRHAREAREEALSLLSRAPLAITVANVTDPPKTVLTRNDILDALRINPSSSGNSLSVRIEAGVIRDQLIGSVAPSLNRPPINLRLTFNTDGTIATNRPSRRGIAVSITRKNIGAITNGITRNINPIELDATFVDADLTEQQMKELGITHLLAAETTDFSGSPPSRKHNIKVGAALYDGILLKPNEEFSFNKLLGEVGAEQGYLPELVIKENKTIPEYGGGICQVSTTAFRTAAVAGLEITQRYPHSYVVRYYGEPGFDATIYPPNPDFRFRNDTPGHLLIQTAVEGDIIRFEYYGTNDGRSVSILGPTVIEANEDGSMRTVVRQIITRGDDVVRSDAFWSSYKPAELYPIIRNPLE